MGEARRKQEAKLQSDRDIRDREKDGAGMATLIAGLFLTRQNSEGDTSWHWSNGPDRTESLSAAWSLMDEALLMGEARADAAIAARDHENDQPTA